MPTTIKLKNSVTTTNTPTSLVQGEVAINITDKKVWVGNAATTPIQIVGAGTTGNAAGSNTQVQYNSSGSFAGDADFTFNGTTVTMANDASISGLTVGKGLAGGGSNTALGFTALSATTSGTENTGVGSGALQAVTSGSSNTAVGRLPLLSNTTGSSNTAVGTYALQNNTTGNYNSAFGMGALVSNTTASNNTAVGYQAGYSNTTGYENSAVGYRSLYANTTGYDNAALGINSLYSNTTGYYNTGVGQNAMLSNSTGAENAAFGRSALQANTTANNNAAFGANSLYSNTTGANNTSVGHNSMLSNTTGSSNVAIGETALQANTTASNNTAVGYQAGYSGTTATNNTILGFQSGYSLTTGGSNTFVGTNAGDVITTGTKNTIVGRYNGNNGGLDIRTASNYIVLSDGDGNPRGIFDGSGNLLVGTTSEQRSGSTSTPRITAYNTSAEGFNSVVSDNTYAGWVHTSLDGGTGTHYCAYFENVVGTAVGQITHNGTNTSYTTSSDYRLKENISPMTDALAKVALLKPCTYTWKESGEESQGFIAHELQEVIPDAVVGEKDAVDVDGKIKPQGIDTSFLVATLTAAIQELKAEVDSLKAQLNNGA